MDFYAESPLVTVDCIEPLLPTEQQLNLGQPDVVTRLCCKQAISGAAVKGLS